MVGKMILKLGFVTIMSISILGFLILLLQGCTSQKMSPALTYIPPGKWFEELSMNPNCQPPCWENINPGASGIVEAYEILRGKNNIWDLKIISSNNRYDIEWSFSDDTGGGWIVSYNQGMYVSFINLQPKDEIPLSSFINKYREPDVLVVRLTESNIRPDIHFLYKGINLQLEGGMITPKGEIRITPNFPISRLFFREEGWIDDFLKSIKNPNLIMKWNGFGAYTYPSD